MFYTFARIARSPLCTLTTLAIHADLKVMTFERFHETWARILAALIGVDDFRLNIFDDRFLNRFNAEIRMHSIEQLVRTRHFMLSSGR